MSPTARSHVVGVAALAATLLLCGLAPATAAPPGVRARVPTTTVYVVQGVPGATVSVTVDGTSVSPAMAAKAISRPLDLSRGTHMATFRAAGWKVSATFTVGSRSADVVLHWAAAKQARPEVTVFTNDVRPVAASQGRLTVAHTAVVPPADVRVDKKVVFADISNGEFVSADVPAGTYAVDIVPTGQNVHPLFGPVDLPVKPGALTRVFAIGEPRDHSMDAVVQTLPLRRAGSDPPAVIDAGSAGLVAPGRADGTGLVDAGDPAPWWLHGAGRGAAVALAVLCLAVLCVCVGVGVGRRRSLGRGR